MQRLDRSQLLDVIEDQPISGCGVCEDCGGLVRPAVTAMSSEEVMGRKPLLSSRAISLRTCLRMVGVCKQKFPCNAFVIETYFTMSSSE